MINISEGVLVKELSDPNIRRDSLVLDICVIGDTVVIPRVQEKTVLYYKLKYD